MKHIFIVNPAAGKSDRTAEYRKMIEAAFAPRGLSYELLVSGAPGECRTLARQAAQSGEEVRLYACGGDGTLNEVVNGVVGYDNAAVTHFPGGSGNDTIKIFDDPAAFTSIERLLDAEEARFDLIRCNDSYALNVLSIGFDARVGTDIARFKRLPLVSGKGAYILSIFSNMLHGLTADYTVTLDSGEVFSGRKTMICVCNGRWYGGGTAYVNAIPAVEKLVAKLSGDEKTGAQIIARALQAPIRQIAENAGVDGSIVYDKIRSSRKVGYGYNAYTETYCDMIPSGIVDPTKVTRTALENAASIASCVLTTESLVADKPDPKADAAMAAAAQGGGMGGMY